MDIFGRSDFQYLAKFCLPDISQATEQTQYGIWRPTQNCTLPATSSRQNDTLPVDSILYGKYNQIIGFKGMIVVTPRRNQFYADKVGLSVKQEAISCIRFGSSSTPLLTVVVKDLCEELSYGFL
jgi:hypothetical protein